MYNCFPSNPLSSVRKAYRDEIFQSWLLSKIEFICLIQIKQVIPFWEWVEEKKVYTSSASGWATVPWREGLTSWETPGKSASVREWSQTPVIVSHFNILHILYCLSVCVPKYINIYVFSALEMSQFWTVSLVVSPCTKMFCHAFYCEREHIFYMWVYWLCNLKKWKCPINLCSEATLSCVLKVLCSEYSDASARCIGTVWWASLKITLSEKRLHPSSCVMDHSGLRNRYNLYWQVQTCG